ncbi:MAG: hypothetical protein AB1801_22700 [Chloroflexota bacterium]
MHYRTEGQVDWTPWLTETSEPQAEFVGLPGQVYTFRVQAADNVNNPAAWLEAGPVAIAAMARYYHHGDQRARPEQGRRVAMRQGDVVCYLHGDHLGSVSLTTDSQRTVVSEGRRMRALRRGLSRACRGERWTEGSTPTDFGFTSQRADSFGLMDYKARYYSAYHQPDCRRGQSQKRIGLPGSITPLAGMPIFVTWSFV